LPPQKAILCDQISQRLSLLAIEPASDGEKQQPNDRHVDHERQLISRSKQHRSPTADPKLEHYVGVFLLLLRSRITVTI